MIAQVKWIIIGGCLAALVVGITSREAEKPAPAQTKTSYSAHRPAPHSAAYADEVVVRRREDGHFWVEADINGVVIPFLIDTGASQVILSPADADRLGLYLTANDYTQAFDTANGMVRAAPVTLGELRVGQLRVSNVAASVNGAPLRQSLLGMSFLGRLESFSYEGDELILRQ